MDRHDQAVARIAAQVRGFHERKEGFRIYHGSTNSTRPCTFSADKMVDTSHLSHVLSVDRGTRTVVVEANVPMDVLVSATRAHGLLPPVVMEFPGITVGGGFAGTAGESSSFRHGFFDRTANWVEMVLADGEVVRASAGERPDLFRGAAGTFGTLGVATLFELRLVDARTYVHLTYRPVRSVAEAIAAIERASEDETVDYIDGILYALDRGVVMTGRRTDGEDGVRVQGFRAAWDPWFYLHAEDMMTRCMSTPTMTPATELIPVQDYLFRYDRGAFWTGKYAYEYFMTPLNACTRWALDAFMHTRVMYHALHESGLGEQYLIQDLALPVGKAEEFIRYVDASLGVYPLWLCPLAPGAAVSMSPHSRPTVASSRGPSASTSTGTTTPHATTTLLNVGVWGPILPIRTPCPLSHFVRTNRDLERKVRELNGMKWLYATAYYTLDELWAIYDREWYDALRRKYGAETLPSVFEKVCSSFDPSDLEETRDERGKMRGIRDILRSTYPLAGVYGVRSSRHVEHARADVDADDPPGSTDESARIEWDQPGAARQVQDGLTGLDVGPPDKLLLRDP
ncbi:MAG: hypothetical protein M1838_000352 [Thelocarpon superellum]|nr:MAG: hypothetical protein M1838_000352 [Thelocarpon superellum]